MYESETVDLLRIAHLSVSGVKGRCERVSSWWTSVIAGRHEAPAGPRTRRLNGGEHVTTSWVVLLVDAMLFNVYTAYTIIAPARAQWRRVTSRTGSNKHRPLREQLLPARKPRRGVDTRLSRRPPVTVASSSAPAHFSATSQSCSRLRRDSAQRIGSS